MSDTESKLLERIASLESELAASRKDKDKPVFDRKRATLDPIAYFKEQGLDVQHLSRHFVASALGKDCPPELAAMVQMGPQIAATSHLEELVNNLSRNVEKILEKDKQRELVASVKNTTVDQVKYPTLASAVKTDPSILERELSAIGSTADSTEALAKIEQKLLPYAKAFGWKPPENSENTSGKSDTTTVDTKSAINPATNGTTGSEVPPLVQLAPGAFTDEDHQKLKAAVLKRYNAIT